MTKLVLAICCVVGCATQLLDGDSPAPPGTVTAASFVGSFTWESAQSNTTVVVCDSGSQTNDPPPQGEFVINAGPAADQVNIGVGTKVCPVLVFDVSNGAGTLSNLGVTCSSPPGTLTTHSGSLTTDDGGNTASLHFVLDIMAPNGAGGVGHCTLTVDGIIARQ